MAFAKLKRAAFAVCCFCCCCLPRRYRNRVGDSNENVQNDSRQPAVEEAKEAQEIETSIMRTDALVVVKDTEQGNHKDNGTVNGGFELNGEYRNINC